MMTFSKFQPLLDLMGVIPAKYNDLISETYSQISTGIPVFSINKTDRHDIAEILLKVALSINFIFTPSLCISLSYCFIILNYSYKSTLYMNDVF
jgi:hypothetical protein